MSLSHDRIGVVRVSVSVSPKTPEIRRKVSARLAIMQRELRYVQDAINSLVSLLGLPDPPSRLLSDRVMDSRNWSLSVAMSHAYVQQMLSTFPFGGRVGDNNLPPLNPGQDNLPELFVRAVQLEIEKAYDEPETTKTDPGYKFVNGVPVGPNGRPVMLPPPKSFNGSSP